VIGFTTYATGDRGTVLTWHVDAVSRELAAVVPGWTVLGAKNPQAAAGSRPSGRVVLVGYSQGCIGVRETLRSSVTSPTAVVCIDGTHSLMGNARPAFAHVAVWRSVAERARRGEMLAVLTTLGNHRYMERSAGAAAYPSTGRVLEAALDLGDGALRTPQAIDQGDLHIRSYPSKETDKEAHIAQLRETLPALWREIVVPYLRRDEQPQTEPSFDESPSPPLVEDTAWLYGFPLGARCLYWLGGEWQVGPREIPGPKHDPRIAGYTRDCRRGGTFLGVDDKGRAIWNGGTPVGAANDEEAWCAKLQSAAMLATWRPGDLLPHGARVSVAELYQDAVKASCWEPEGNGYEPQAGDLEILGREGGEPTRGGKGHVRARVATLSDGYFTAIGGNEQNQIVWSTQPRRNPDRKGWIRRSPRRVS
jgi:hypothetical protein